MKWLEKLMQKPSEFELVVREVNEAKRQRLAAQTGRDYAEAMVKYHDARIERLETYMEAMRCKSNG